MQRMAGIDAAYLYMETPSMHLHVVGVLVLDPGGAPDGFPLEKLCEVLDKRIHLAGNCRFGEYARRFLERRGGDKGTRL